jgi:hypothetical protein
MQDDDILSAMFGIEPSDPVTVETNSGPVILNISYDKLDVDIGVSIPNLVVQLDGASETVEFEYLQEGTSTWKNFYSGQMSTEVVLSPPYSGKFRVRVRGIMYTTEGKISEVSPYFEYPQVIDVTPNLNNPSAPSNVTLKYAKVNDGIERYDVKVSWNWDKNGKAGIKSFVIWYVTKEEFDLNVSDRWATAKKLSVGNSTDAILTGFPYKVPYKLMVRAYSFGEAPNNVADSNVLDILINESTNLESSFTRNSLVETTYAGIKGYRLEGSIRKPTFLLDAVSGNFGLGQQNPDGTFPIQLNGSTGTLSVDGGIITKKINAADFVLTNFTGKDNPALYSEGKVYGSSVAGLWMGMDNTSGKYKLDIGNSSSYIRWDGTRMTISGEVQIGTSLGSIDLDDLVAKRIVWVYKEASVRPATPTGNLYPPSGWSKVPVAISDPSNVVWASQGELNEISGKLEDGTVWQTPIQFTGSRGVDGASGLNNATVFLYRRSTSTPPLPSVTTTYTFSTKTLTGANNGWTQAIPAGTAPIYVTAATASSVGDKDTIASNEWAGATVLAQNGTNGSDGLNSATVFLYRRSTTTPALPSETTTYTFSSGVLSGVNNGWTQTVPAGSNPLYVTTATAVSASETDTISAGEWAAVKVLAQNGVDGASGYSAFKSIVFLRSNSTPSTPTGGTFSSPVPSGWSDGIPSGKTILWSSTRIFTSNGEPPQTSSWTTPRQMTDTSSLEIKYSSVISSPGDPTNNAANWSSTSSTSTIWMAQREQYNGIWTAWSVFKVKGETGPKGDDGSDGTRGAGFYVISSSTGAWSDSIANSATPGGVPVKDDVVTIFKSTDTKVSNTRRYNGSAWVSPGFVVHGDMIATGTISGDRFVAGTSITAPLIMGGQLITDTGTGFRTIVGGPGDYSIWAGSGTQNDTNGIFWIKKNGIGFIKNTFFQGSIVESHQGTSTTGNPRVVEFTHNSGGRVRELTAIVDLIYDYFPEDNFELSSRLPETLDPFAAYTSSVRIYRDNVSIASGAVSITNWSKEQGEGIPGNWDFPPSARYYGRGTIVFNDNINPGIDRAYLYKATASYRISPNFTGTNGYPINSQTSVNLLFKSFEDKIGIIVN